VQNRARHKPARTVTGQRLNRGEKIMKPSHFFIDRPIFGIVISIVTVLLGGIAFTILPVALYPEISPPRRVEEGRTNALGTNAHGPGLTRLIIERALDEFVVF
jgi:hypothetical protein